jgi:chromosome segregation ATPase
LPQTEFEVLQTRLSEAEEHRQGLLVHSRNLEHLVGESSTHASNLADLLAQCEQSRTALAEHVGNLEHDLTERDKDLRQTKQLLEELEARLYRYEQILADSGVDLPKTP